MTPAELSRTVLATVRRAVAADELRVAVPVRIVVQRPPRPGCGDYATNVALQLAGPAGLRAYEVAEILGRRLAKEPGIAQVEIAGPGFLNITLNALAYADVVRQVREQGDGYGRGDGLADDAVTVVADPDAVRATMVAEVVNRLLDAAGARPGPPEVLVVAEPPVEPALPEGVGVPAQPAVPPPAGFADLATVPPSGTGSGAGLAVHATVPPPGPRSAAPPLDPSSGRTALSAALGDDAYRWAMLRPPAEDVPAFGAGLPAGLLEQREANPLFRIRYAYARTRALLRNARELGVQTDDAPNPAAEAADPAPVAATNLAARPTSTAANPALSALPADPGYANTPAFPASPASPANATAPSSRANPAAALPANPAPSALPANPTPALPANPAAPAANPCAPIGAADPYHHPAETELLGLIADFPRVVETAARRRAPDRLARHLERLADAFARFHDECPALPKGDEKPSAVHAARIRLADATGIVLADGLHLLGISAPDHL